MVSGFLLKLIRESAGLTQVQLAEQLAVDVASVQGWESGRRPLAALRAADLVRLRFRLLRCGAQPTLLATLEDAIQADLIIAETVQAGGQVIEADGHPLGAIVHQRKLSDLITWPFTGIAPAPLRDLMTARVRRGPVPAQPTLTEDERTCFFDHLLMTADTKPNEDTALARRQAIYLLGFDTRASTSECLRVEHIRALRDAGRTDNVSSCVFVRSSAVALAYGGDRDPLRAFLQHAQASDRLELANLNYWAYWVGEIDGVQVDDEFMSRVDPQGWSGVRLLGHLLELLHPGSGHAELNPRRPRPAGPQWVLKPDRGDHTIAVSTTIVSPVIPPTNVSLI
ncbi:MAG: helix-turn-helix transcriptional regulator [Actinomycetota bacterium]|nr:helix-turn-helix transcriptional regulator [Actinomycetota bacterium]